MFRLFLLCLMALPVFLYSDKPSDILIYGGGNIEVTASIDHYQDILPDKPFSGTVMVTHDKQNKVDPSSFKMGDKPLKVRHLQNVQISSNNPFMVTIYSFTVDGMKEGVHDLPPVKVLVGGKEYQSDPLYVEIDAP